MNYNDKVKLAKEVLIKARDQQISEMAACGSAGGVGRVGNQAPTFVAIMNALAFVNGIEASMEETTSDPSTATIKDVADKMAALRAAKAAKQTNAE